MESGHGETVCEYLLQQPRLLTYGFRIVELTCPSENGHRARQAPGVRDGFLGFLRHGGIRIRVVWKMASSSLPDDAGIDATSATRCH